MSRFIIILSIISAISAAAIDKFICPAKNGQYEDPDQCDKFYQCTDGVVEELLCPDGLVFDPTNRKINKCDHVFNVDCGDRLTLQEPQPKGVCPRRNGFFAHPDSSVCDTFFNCIEGDPIKTVCTNGLHFDEYSGTCVWPDTAGRVNCNDVNKKLKDGFECTQERQTDSRGMLIDHPKYGHPHDCQKFYVCLNGVMPREQGCSDGTVYNDEQQRCDAPENVPGCEDWYKEQDDKKP